MSSTTKRRARWVGVPLLAAASIALASPAMAATIIGQNQPTVVQAAQGSTTTLNWTYKNTGGGFTVNAPGSMVFNAPTGTTFPAQSTVPTSYSSDGTTFGANTATLTGCTVGGGGATLTCTVGAPAAGAGWPAGSSFRFSPTVTVDPAAAPGTQSAASVFTFNTASPNPTTETINDGTLDVNIVQSASTPMVDPVVGLGAGALVVGTGAAVVINRRRRAGAGIQGS